MSLAPGIAPDVKGDPIIAFIAQLNRYQKQHGQPEYPYVDKDWRGNVVGPAKITDAMAVQAISQLQVRIITSLATIPDIGAEKELKILNMAMAGDRVGYVMSNLHRVTQQLALHADAQNFEPARVGITGKLWTGGQWATVIGASLLGGIAAFLGFQRARRAI